MYVFLLAKSSASLRLIRETAESAGMKFISCCSANALLSACVRGSGCVLIAAMDFTPSDVKSLVQKLRISGYSHSILVADLNPTLECVLEWTRLPICEYFQLQTSPEILQTIFHRALEWTRHEGIREVVKVQITQRWETLDSGLKDVMRLLYDGKTNRDVAEELKLSSRTVENRRAKLLEIFGVNSFAELIRVATEFMEGEIIPKVLLLE